MAEAGDIVRRIVYPLVVPIIVACVWAHAWAMKNDEGPIPMAPPVSHEAAVTSMPAFPEDPVRPRGYHFLSEDDGVASAGADDLRE